MPLAEFIPLFTQFASSAISAAQVRRQNKYNSPKEQVRRLREAGIPLHQADKFDNTQRSLPDVSGIQQAGATLANYFGTMLQQAERAKLQGVDTQKVLKEIDLLTQEGQLKVNEISKSDADYQFWQATGIIQDGEFKSNYTQKLEIEKNMQSLDNLLKTNEKTISDINTRIATATEQDQIDLVRNQVQEVLQNWKLKKNIRVNNEAINAASQTVINTMKEGGLNFGEALLMLILQQVGGQVGSGGFQIGL